MLKRVILSATLVLSPVLAQAEGVWNDPLSFARLASNSCITGAMMPDKVERAEFFAGQFDLDYNADPAEGTPDIGNALGISVVWEPEASPSIFCGLIAPAGLYDADGLTVIMDWLNEGNDTPVAKIDDGMYGPIPRKILDGREINFVIVDDSSDGLTVMGMIQ